MTEGIIRKSLEDYVYRQKPYDNIAWMPPHSTENDQQLNRPLRRSTRLTSPVHHPNQVKDWTSVLFDSAMLCWMPVLSAAQEEIKEVCVCGAKNEGFNLVQNPNPMQRNACPPSSTCRATGAGKGSWHLCTHTDEGSDGHVASREHHLPYPQTLFECFGVYPH